MFRVFLEALDPLPANAWSRHLYIDVESEGNGWAVVVRGEDRAIVGRSNRPWEAALLFNGTDGNYRRFVVLATDKREHAERIVRECRGFYNASGSIGERLAACAGNAIIPLLLTRFIVRDFGAGNGTWRRCLSYNSKRKAGVLCAA